MELGFCERWLFNRHGDDLSMWVLPNEVTWTFRAFDILFVVTLRKTEVKCNYLPSVHIFTITSYVNVQYFTVPKVKSTFLSSAPRFQEQRYLFKVPRLHPFAFAVQNEMMLLWIAVGGANFRLCIIAANISNYQPRGGECSFTYLELGFGRRSSKSALTVALLRSQI
jgi:hypothetical protein